MVTGKLAALFALVALASPAAAAPFVPNTSADAPDWNPGDGICEATAQGSGICTLRAAIQEWGAQGGLTWRTIDLRNARFLLQEPGGSEDEGVTGDLDTRGFLIIQGAGVGQTIIDGNGLDRVFDNHGYLLELRDLTIRGGVAPEFGGGGANTQLGGTLRLVRCEVTGNEAPRGGGISVVSAKLELEDSTVSGNHAEDAGGGIDILYLGSEVEIVRSAITWNTVDSFGGGIVATGDTTIVNSTISGNGAGIRGGGIIASSGGTTNLHNVTVTNNSASAAAGIYTGSDHTFELRNTVLAGNHIGPAISDDCDGPLISRGYNLFGDSDCEWSGDPSGVQEGVDPLLGPLADNGGPTASHLLQEGSSAIDAGNPSGCLDPEGGVLAEDQRGENRRRDGDGRGGARCDIGAVEVVPEPSAGWAASICFAALGALARRRRASL